MAQASEELVKEMCKDIKALDTAKTNLTFSIKAITHYSSIFTILKSLEHFCLNKNYKKIKSSLAAFQDLIKFFKGYAEISQIKVTNKSPSNI